MADKSIIPKVLLAVLVVAGVIPRVESRYSNTLGWTGLSIDRGYRVTGAETWVVLKAYNIRGCLRMCWLFSACSALTFTKSSRRCQLHRQSTGAVAADYSLVLDADSVAVNMKSVSLDAKMKVLYGCDLRPCRESEMCASVRNTVSYVCLPLESSCEGDPPSVPNSVSLHDHVRSVVYECAQGYLRTGNSYVSQCDRNTGTWSDVDVTCSFVDCGNPPSISGAMASGISTSADSMVTYTCMTGAVSASPIMAITCEASTGQWSSLPGPCSVVSCGQPPEVDNMDAQLTERSLSGAYPGLTVDELKMAYGGEAVYTCKDGYSTPPGASYSSQCQADGSWSSAVNFECLPVDCGAPPFVADSASVLYTKTTLGENVTITCAPGFAPLNGLTLSCSAAGTWLGPEMTCEQIDCGTPPPLDNATITYTQTVLNSTAKYSCIEPAVVRGEDKEDNGTAVCQEDGSWSNVSLLCLPVPCGEMLPVANSSVEYGLEDEIFVAYFTCEAGFVHGANEMIKCMSFGGMSFWRRDFVSCNGVSCGAAPAVDNATTRETGQNYPSSAFYTCDSGFYLTSATSARNCNAAGEWSLEDVVCSPVVCPVLRLPDNAELRGQVTPAPSYSHGNAVEVTCVPAYSMILASGSNVETGVLHMSCVEGSWASSSAEVICVPAECGAPLALNLPNMEWEVSEGAQITGVVQCSTGYLPVNQYNIAAQDPGANLTAMTECQPPQGWEVPFAFAAGCIPVSCGADIIAPDSGLQVPNSYKTSYQSTVEVSCEPPLYKASQTANYITVCQADGQWSSLLNTTELCAPCDQGEDAAGIPNSILRINTANGAVSDTATLTCAEGYYLLGHSGPVECASVDGAPTWQGLTNVSCIQTRWLNPTSVNTDFTKYVAPVHMAAATGGLKACATVTFVGPARFRLTLAARNEHDLQWRSSARVTYYKDHDGFVNRLRFQYSADILPANRDAGDASITVTESKSDLMSVGETATLCIVMDLANRKYKFLKNDVFIMEMDIVAYEETNYFVVRDDISVSEINIDYETTTIIISNTMDQFPNSISDTLEISNGVS